MGTVVVALQGEPGDDSALVHEGAAIARRIGGSLVAVRVVGRPSPEDQLRLAQAIRSGREARVAVEAELLTAADPALAIAEASRRHDADVVLVEPGGNGRAGRRLARRIRKLSHALAFSVSAAKGGS
jgi:hypothetical protein